MSTCDTGWARHFWFNFVWHHWVHCVLPFAVSLLSNVQTQGPVYHIAYRKMLFAKLRQHLNLYSPSIYWRSKLFFHIFVCVHLWRTKKRKKFLTIYYGPFGHLQLLDSSQCVSLPEHSYKQTIYKIWFYSLKFFCCVLFCYNVSNFTENIIYIFLFIFLHE